MAFYKYENHHTKKGIDNQESTIDKKLKERSERIRELTYATLQIIPYILPFFEGQEDGDL